MGSKAKAFGTLWPMSFFLTVTALTGMYTLSLHDALPILIWLAWWTEMAMTLDELIEELHLKRDRTSKGVNSSQSERRYAVACQNDCIGVTIEEGLHGDIVLLFDGAQAAISD